MLVSRLGFGGIPIQRLNEDEAVAVVKRCLDLGITFLDTANAYTTSEERIGEAIAGRHEELVLATKSTSRKREGVEKHLNLSLARRLPPEHLFSGLWGQIVEKASGCIECGECEERCPYHLPIRELLAEYVKQYRKGKRKYQKAQPSS